MITVFLDMQADAVKGLGRLRISALLSLVTSLLALPLSGLFGRPESTTENPLTLFVALMWVLVFGLAILALGITSWVFKVLGWWSMCRSGMRKFYCATRYAVLLGPIVGVALLLVGGVALLLEMLGSGALVDGGLSGEPVGSALPYILPGLIVMVVANVIEGVSALDVGLLTEVKVLTLGAAIYLVASLLQPFQLLASAFGSTALLGDAASWWSWASNAASLLASLLLAVGFHWARDRVIQSEAQREAAGTA